MLPDTSFYSKKASIYIFILGKHSREYIRGV